VHSKLQHHLTPFFAGLHVPAAGIKDHQRVVDKKTLLLDIPNRKQEHASPTLFMLPSSLNSRKL